MEDMILFVEEIYKYTGYIVDGYVDIINYGYKL